MFLMFYLISRYGSSANLVLSTGNGVHGFTLDPGLGEFILTHPDVCHKRDTFRHADINSDRPADQDPASRKDLLL